MEKADDLPELLRQLGRYQRQINAELAKAKPDQDKIAAALISRSPQTLAQQTP
jgi:hypothetical protein